MFDIKDSETKASHSFCFLKLNREDTNKNVNKEDYNKNAKIIIRLYEIVSNATDGHRGFKDVWMSHTHGGFPLRLNQISYLFLIIVLDTVIIISVTLPFENFEESKSKDCFHMVLRKHAFSDLIRMKWRISIWTQVRGSETLFFSIEMLLQYFDCLSTVASYPSIMYK